MAVSPITLFWTVPFVSLWLPVRGCVSHHSILNSSICFFMTTCVWLCLPSLYSEQFHLFLYDYLCWLCLPSLYSQQFHLFLYDYLCVAVSPITRFWTVPFVSLRLPVRDCVSHLSILYSSICFFMTTCAWLCLPSLYSQQFHLFLYDYLCVAVSPITRFWTVPCFSN